MTGYLSKQHPWTVAVYMFFILFFIMTTPYDTQMILLFVLLSVNSIVNFGIVRYVKSLKMYLIIIVALALFNVIFNPKGDTPFLYINDRPFTKESLYYGVYMGFMVSALMIWFQLFQLVFDNSRITYLIGSRLPVIGLIISMVFCYHEKFRTKIDKIQEVWNTYGIDQQFSTVKKAGIVLAVLLTVMLEDSVDTALSMCARGYGKGKRTSYKKYSFEGMDCILLVASVGMLAVYIFGLSQLYGCLVFYLMLPVVYNIVKELQWKFYLSKI